MNSDLNFFIGLYLSSAGSSVIMNVYIYSKNHKTAKKEALKKLKYKKGLSFKTKLHLSMITHEHLYDMIDGILYSILPVGNVVFTLNNIAFIKEFDDISKEVYEEIVEESNQIEDNCRKKNVELLRNIRDSLSIIPEDVNLNNKYTRLTKRETKKILKLNHLNYKSEMLKFEKKEDLV